MQTHEWIDAGLKHAGLSAAELAEQLSQRLERPYTKQHVHKMRRPPAPPGADAAIKARRKYQRRKVQPEELLAIAEITGYALPPELMPRAVYLAPHHGSAAVAKRRTSKPSGRSETVHHQIVTAAKTDAANLPTIGSTLRDRILANGEVLIEPDARALYSKFLRLILAFRQSGEVEMRRALSTLPEEEIKDGWIVPSTYLRTQLNVHGDALVWEILGDSGYDPKDPHAIGSVHNGDRVIVDLSDTHPFPAGPFLVADGIGFAVKWIEQMRSDAEQLLRISTKNPRYTPEIVAVEKAGIVGRVCARISRML